MVYVKKLTLPSEREEIDVISDEKRTIFNTFYPFNIFPNKGLNRLDLDGITLLYGGNGSGKSTLINVIASKTYASRRSDFNDAPFFDRFVEMCGVEYTRVPEKSVVLTSDDVFDYALKARSVNENIDAERNALIDKYVELHGTYVKDPEIGRLRGLDDYERWHETWEILSPRKTQSKYIKKRTPRDIELFSNGETAMKYFLERVDEDALYLLDEPENSLSVEYQIQLAEYIEATAIATGSQFVIATHSPIFLAMKRAKIYNLDSCPVSVCRWTELPNVRKYFDFFMDHKNEFDT